MWSWIYITYQSVLPEDQPHPAFQDVLELHQLLGSGLMINLVSCYMKSVALLQCQRQLNVWKLPSDVTCVELLTSASPLPGKQVMC